MKMAARGQRDVSSDESAPAGDHLRRGPWTVEEDLLLVNYIAAHGEGHWNALARCAGLKRTGKSCRLRWLNYLRPDLRRGNMTAQEQLLILELHSRWGNRWSKIAQHLPGRTDNEIKNYWRTRVQKHARQLGCDVGSQRFRDLVRYLWMPRLLERASLSAGDDDAFVTAPRHDVPPLLSVFPVDDVELSCTTSSSSMSSNEIQQQKQQQLVSPPALVANAAAESAPGGNSDAFTCDTWCQPPPQHTEYAGQFSASGTCCDWSDESLLVPGFADVYGDMMGMGLPELGETLWGGGTDDLWYTQIMGL